MSRSLDSFRESVLFGLRLLLDDELLGSTFTIDAFVEVLDDGDFLGGLLNWGCLLHDVGLMLWGSSNLSDRLWSFLNLGSDRIESLVELNLDTLDGRLDVSNAEVDALLSVSLELGSQILGISQSLVRGLLGLTDTRRDGVVDKVKDVERGAESAAFLGSAEMAGVLS